MDKGIIEAELQNQLKTIKKILEEECKPRFAMRHINFDEPAQLIRGARGAGKTFSTLHALAASGKDFAYADISQFRAASELDFETLYESLSMVYGKFGILVIDECADMAGLCKIISKFNQNGIGVIGIYSGMHELIQAEMSIPLTTLYPLSFSEYCIWHNVDTENNHPDGIAEKRKAFNDFMARGGFPEMQSKVRFARTASKLKNSIIENDIRGSFRKAKIAELRETANDLMSSTSELINYKQIAEKLNIGSEITAKKYVEAIKESGCMYVIERFGQIHKQRTILEKSYVADSAFASDRERQKKLEAIVYMQLRRFCERHGYEMHYYAKRNIECDFALCSNKRMRTIIQVIADYSDSEIIKEKVRGLIAMSKETGCNNLFILTDSMHDTIEAKDLTVTVMPTFEFLLDRSHKIVTD